ncbi:zinc finger protein 384a isoform X1 [Lampris incognitus]|uniref:zinc finger protein 384a isoform X1 n=2 Tax=Lampris incognitus TaxID=2546036 RepID=UPI0024B579AF|nr:zinc finger protein 384a isoform X1 [Lampris incognitus]XP_056154132.1 zinc finger protein 384a isoform X1 [Lampris incognitus]
MEDSHFNSSYFWSPVPTVQGQIENAMFLNKMAPNKDPLGPDKPNHPSFAPHTASSTAASSSSTSSSSTSHYPPVTSVLTVPGSMDPGPGGRAVPKQEGGGGGGGSGGTPILGGIGGHLHQPHSSQNVTVVPVPSTGIMTAAGLVITAPQGTLVPTTSTQSFVAGHPSAPTMIVSAVHPSNTVVMPTPGKRGRKRKQVMGRVAGVGGVLPPGSDALILAHLAAGGQHHTADPYDLSNDEEDHTSKDGPKSYRCRMCAVTFFSKSDMQIHAKSHTEAKPHKCPHCSKSFANSSYLAQHIRIHSGAKPYTCSYCQKTFRQLSHLQQHTRNHTEAKPHKCPHCSKSFANSSYLAQHIRIHSGAKPYTCSYCQKTFRQLSHLQQHTRIHTGDRPYKCVHPGCEKAFTQLSNLQSHRRQHNKDKPYKCHNCNRGYTDATSLEVHLSTHTVKHAKLFSCGLCNRSYTSETYLMKHMRKHNPDPLTVAAAVAAQQAQGHTPGGGRGRGRGRGRGGGAGGVAGRATQVPNQPNPNNPNSGPPGSYQPPQQPTEAVVPCPFDLHQYKTVATGEIQYKPASVADLSVAHKDLCLTVSTSAIQVEHMNS